MGAHVDFQRTVRPARLSALVTAMLVLHILALKLLSLPSDRHPFVWFDVRLQTESNLMKAKSRTGAPKQISISHGPHIGHFYHTVDIFTTHWTFLPHSGNLYHTLDIFTTRDHR
jgi:hypothetical protein